MRKHVPLEWIRTKLFGGEPGGHRVKENGGHKSEVKRKKTEKALFLSVCKGLRSHSLWHQEVMWEKKAFITLWPSRMGNIPG